jgi:hypothetical protein
MAIRQKPITDAYRDGWDRVFPDGQPPKPSRCPECKRVPCDPNFVHTIPVQMVTCGPCNEEHPRGEPCPKCGRSLLLG